MKKKTFSLSEDYRLLEPRPVMLVTTARARHANVIPMIARPGHRSVMSLTRQKAET
jgi:hypothetical protein